MAVRSRKRQQMTRIPPFRPGDEVRVLATGPVDLWGQVQVVRSLTCTVTGEGDAPAVWRVHLANGLSVEVRHVELHREGAVRPPALRDVLARLEDAERTIAAIGQSGKAPRQARERYERKYGPVAEPE